MGSQPGPGRSGGSGPELRDCCYFYYYYYYFSYYHHHHYHYYWQYNITPEGSGPERWGSSYYIAIATVGFNFMWVPNRAPRIQRFGPRTLRLFSQLLLLPFPLLLPAPL